MQVLIVRHAIAVEPGTPPYEDDAERPLTDKGRSRMKSAARTLAALLPRPEAIYTSPLVRAAQTAALVAQAWDGRPAPEVADVLAPGNAPSIVRRWLKTVGSEGLVVLVGHEPGCSDLLAHLVSGDALAVDFKKGAAALVETGVESVRPTGTLLWLASPRLLRAAAG